MDDKIRCLLMAQPSDLRRAGWAVAVHNDYQLNGEPHTFWLFTKKIHGTTIAVKGEGPSDAVALNEVRQGIYEGGWNTLTDGFLSDPSEAPGG